jgi:hypothetical protein
MRRGIYYLKRDYITINCKIVKVLPNSLIKIANKFLSFFSNFPLRIQFQQIRLRTNENRIFTIFHYK